MDSSIVSSTSLPCLNKKKVESSHPARDNHGMKTKQLGTASEPLLATENSDEQRSQERVSKCCENVTDKVVITECEEPHLFSKQHVGSLPSLEYCFFCSQSGPVIEEKVCDGQKLKRKTKSQSLQALGSFGSNSSGPPHAQVNSCSLTEMESSKALFAKGAALKTQHPGRNSSKLQSISSLHSKATEMNESCGLMCRICHGGYEEGELIRPCKCTGTVKYAHQSCVLNWVSKSGNQSCELCGFKFRTHKKSVKCFWKWKFPEVSTKGWLHIGLFIAFATMLLTSITWIIWSRVSKTPSAIAERTTEEVKFAYMVNGLFIALAVGGLYFDSLRHFKQYSKRWAALNQNVVVECYANDDGSKVEGLGVTYSAHQRPQSFVSMAVEETETNRLSIQPASDGGTRSNDPAAWV